MGKPTSKESINPIRSTNSDLWFKNHKKKRTRRLPHKRRRYAQRIESRSDRSGDDRE